jgi:hypothetical protein
MQIKQNIHQLFKSDNIIFFIFCFSLLFSVVLSYPLHFDYADEIAAALLGIVCFRHLLKQPKILLQPVFILLTLFFVFFAAYSFMIESNVPQAILQDILVSLKPFIGFFGVFLLAPRLSDVQRKIIRYASLLLALLCLCIALYSGLFWGERYMSMAMFAGSVINFYLIIAVLSMVYLFSSDFDRKSFLIFFAILAIGLLTGRTKLYVLIIIAASLYIFGFHKRKLKINFQTLFISLAVIIVVAIVAYPKIHYYFFNPETLYPARRILYGEAFHLMREHFPIGAGFASFGSFASTKYLSALYEQGNMFEALNLANLKGNYATDSFFASLAGQFGVLGILAFFSFLLYLFKISLKNFSTRKQYFTLLVILFLISESFSNSTFTQSFSFIAMMMLGYVLSKNHHKSEFSGLDDLQNDKDKSSIYSPEDFISAPKFDAHLHYHTFNDTFVKKAKKINLRLLSVNTDFDFSIEKQQDICQDLKKKYPNDFDFITTFNAESFSSETFSVDSIAQIKKGMAVGARGVKIWKNIGMQVKNADGEYIMLDNPVFNDIFSLMEKEHIPLLLHTADPRDCWQSLDRMTLKGDVKYYSDHPEFHAFLHPDIPDYEAQMQARDRILERFPQMTVVGAHLGSMEWRIEEVSERFERFPQFYVDISGCFDYLFLHAQQDRELVLDFFEKYHKRIIYGSDFFVADKNIRRWLEPLCRYFPKIYSEMLFQYMKMMLRKHWLFLSSDQKINIGNIAQRENFPTYLQGLQLPKEIIDNIFYRNAEEVYLMTE